MPRTIRLALALATLLTPTLALATTGETKIPKPTAHQDAAQADQYSNWPDKPERQGGREYTKFTRPEVGGPVERNFESGRN